MEWSLDLIIVRGWGDIFCKDSMTLILFPFLINVNNKNMETHAIDLSLERTACLLHILHSSM